MQEVYSNCIINLSLTRAAHPNDSCFAGYKTDAILPFEVETTDTSDANAPKRCTNTVFHTTYFREALYDQPLGHRAWVLQERMLATRVLSIGLGELFWDCMQVPHASESLPHGFSAYSPASLTSLEDAIDLVSKALPLTSEYKTLKQAWCSIVDEYTARRLTYPEMDKLVAISAIASRCHRMDDMYIAGHFLRMLPQSLGWSRDARDKFRDPAGQFSQRLINPSNQVTGFGKLKTPTWSWASMDGPLVRPSALYYDWMPLANIEVYTTHQVDDEGAACPVYTILLTICTHCFVLTWKEEKKQQDPTGVLLLCVDLSRQWMKLEDLGLIKVVLDNPNDQLMDGVQ
jgi:hypothetical protein